MTQSNRGVEQGKFDIDGGSDVGRKRTENQDHFLIGELRRQLIIRQTDVPDSLDNPLFGCQEGRLLVIADGMGGHHAGEQASRTAVEASAQYVLDMMQWFLKLSPDDEQDFEDDLANCLSSIQKRLWSMSGPNDRRMGTTVTMAYILGKRLFVVHAGDSRCYLLRDGELKQLTTDHTIAQQLIDSGGIPEDDPALRSWRHVLWNCVGGGNEEVRPEVSRCQIQAGDLYLLCSDGLTGMVEDDAIRQILTTEIPSKGLVTQLIQAANDAGGHDNISVIVGRVESIDSQCDESVDDPPTTTIVSTES